MAGREMELLLKIKGNLESSYPASLRKALSQAQALENKYGKLSSSLREQQKLSNSSVESKYLAEQAKQIDKLGGLKVLQAQSEQYAALKRAQGDNNKTYSEAKAKVKELGTQYQQAQQSMTQLKAKEKEVKAAFQQSQKTTENLKNKLEVLNEQRKVLGSSGKSMLDAVRSGEWERLIANIEQTKKAIAESKKATAAAKKEYKTLSQGVKQASYELGEIGSSYSRAKINAKNIGVGISGSLTALKQLESSLKAAGYSTQNFGASQLHLRTQIAQVTAQIERQAVAQARMQQARANQSQASSNFYNASGNFDSAISTAQQVMSPLVTSIEKAMTLERTMSEVKALTQMDNIKAGNFDQVKKEMTELENQVEHLGATTNFTQDQVAQAQVFIARTGWDTNKILASTPHFLNLAAAGHMEIARTADIATNIMTAFGLEADKTEHVTDVLAYTFTHSNQDLNQLGETLKYAAPVAKMFGSSLEETAAMTKFMADAGIQGSMAGTSLRQTMLRLVAPPKKASKVMDEMGVTVDDATAAWQNANEIAQSYGVTLDETLTPGKQMASVMKQIDEKMSGLSAHEKMAAFSAITGINAVSGALNLFEAGSDKLEEFTKLLENCGGAADQTRKVMTDNATGAIEILNSAIEAVQTNVGKAFLNSIKNVAGAITPIISDIAAWVKANQELVFGVGTAAAAISAFAVGIAGFGAIAAGFSYGVATIKVGLLGLQGAFAAVRTASLSSMIGMVGSMLPVIAVIAAVAAAAYLIYDNWSTVGPYLTNLWGQITAAVSGAWSALQPAIAQIGAAFQTLSTSIGGSQSIISVLIGAFAALGTGIAGALATAITTAANFVAMIIGVLGGITTFITGVLAGDWSTAWQGLCNAGKALFEGFVNTIKALFGGIIDTVSGVMDIFSGIKGGNIGEVVQLKNDSAKGIAELQSTPTTAPVQSAETSAATSENAEAQRQAAQAASENASAQQETAAAVQQSNSAYQQAAENLPGLNEAFQQTQQAIVPTGESMTQMQASVEMANMGLTTNNTELTNNTTQLTAVNSSLQQFQAALTAAGAALQSFNGALAGTNGGLQALSTSSSSAVSAISGLGSAAQSAVSAIQSAASSAASAAASAGAKPAANYLGGIYPKGEFLTTFAERSPEAAIPIDGSQRAVELWKQTGAMLGVYNGEVTPSIDSAPSISEQTKEIEQLKTYQKSLIDNPKIAVKTSTIDSETLQTTSMTEYFSKEIETLKTNAIEFTNDFMASTIPKLELPKLPKLSEIIQLPDLNSMIPKLPSLSEIIQLPDFQSMIPKLPNLSEMIQLPDLQSMIPKLPNLSEIIQLPDLNSMIPKLPNLSEMIQLPDLQSMIPKIEIPPINLNKMVENGIKAISGLFGKKKKPKEVTEQLQTIENEVAPALDYKTDKLGNYQDYQGTAENLVQYGDLSPVRDAKLEAQRQSIEMAQSLPTAEITTAQEQALPAAEAMSMTEEVAGESAMPDAMEPPASESGEISIEYNAPTININGGNVDDSILAQIKAMLDEQQKSFADRVQRVIRDQSIRDRRVSFVG